MPIRRKAYFSSTFVQFCSSPVLVSNSNLMLNLRQACRLQPKRTRDVTKHRHCEPRWILGWNCGGSKQSSRNFRPLMTKDGPSDHQVFVWILEKRHIRYQRTPCSHHLCFELWISPFSSTSKVDVCFDWVLVIRTNFAYKLHQTLIVITIMKRYVYAILSLGGNRFYGTNSSLTPVRIDRVLKCVPLSA